MAPTHHFIKFFILSYWSIPTFHCIVFISTANLLHFFILRFKTKRFEDERFPTIYDKKKEDFSSYSDYQYPLLVYLAFMPLKLFYHFIIKLFYHFIITFPMIKKRRSSYRSISFSLLIPLVSSPLNSSTLISLYSHQVILIFIEIKFAIPPDYKNIHVF